MKKTEQTNKYKHHRTEKNLGIYSSIESIGREGGLWVGRQREGKLRRKNAKLLLVYTEKEATNKFLKTYRLSNNEQKFYVKIVNFLLLF
jgi:hypothetical protein